MVKLVLKGFVPWEAAVARGREGDVEKGRKGDDMRLGMGSGQVSSGLVYVGLP